MVGSEGVAWVVTSHSRSDDFVVSSEVKWTPIF